MRNVVSLDTYNSALNNIIRLIPMNQPALLPFLKELTVRRGFT